jgi:co-chaperonin GroES (HSP10)
MKSPFFFLIKPKGEHYKNKITLAGKEIIVNSTVENHKHVNRFAEVLHVPSKYKGDIKVGDTLIVHHNVFRIYYDMKGRPRKSPNYFKDNIYFIDPYQFYLFHDGERWNSVGDYCFIKPIELENKYLHEEGEELNTGILVYGNRTLDKLGVQEGNKVNFTKDSEYEFVINDEKLYRMRANDICTILN